MPKYSCAAMLRMPFIFAHGMVASIVRTSSGTWVAASPITTSAKQTASTVFSSFENDA